MLWVKAFHLVFMVTWFAGLFYLPRLYVYHAGVRDAVSDARFRVMERKLFWGIMTPSGVLTLGFGVWLWLGYGFGGGWLWWKLGLVGGVVLYHFWCYARLRDFAGGGNRYGHVYYRWWNEVPAILLVGIVVLAVIKPG